LVSLLQKGMFLRHSIAKISLRDFSGFSSPLYISKLVSLSSSQNLHVHLCFDTMKSILLQEFLPMLVGYARVSTTDQTLHLQLDQLKQAGCERWYTDTMSGAKSDRPGLGEALSYVRPGDTFVVWKLDRLGRSLPHLIETITRLQEQSIGFRSLTENIDTTTPGGKLIFHIFGSLAEFERDLIRERTTAGLAAARARGRLGGRPKKLTGNKVQTAQHLYDAGMAIPEICSTLGISRATLYRSISSTKNRDHPSPGTP
jgi:DNA invertase Pin-like site-specific DNA recombinase